MDTFWYFVFVLFVLVPLIVIWMGCVIDVVARPDKGFFAKAVWVVAMLIFPLIGCLVYMITRPKEVVVSEPGMYDEIYGTGTAAFPSSQSAYGRGPGRTY